MLQRTGHMANVSCGNASSRVNRLLSVVFRSCWRGHRMNVTDKKCPDCGRPLKPIKILDNARYGVQPAQGS